MPSKNEEGLCSTMLWRFCTALDQASEQHPVLLIDEYDAPLNACIGKPELFNKVANKISEFYIFLKASCSCLRFFFMTGICNYQLFRVFSSGTFISNISLDCDCSTLLGYTEEELVKYFHPYIENAAKTNGISFEDCLTKMKENYGGYCFESRAETRVFNPWSILNFLKNPELGFKNYWIETATKTDALINYIKAYSLKIPEYNDHDPLIWFDALGPANEYDSEKGLALLTHTGCLSIKDRVSKSLAEIKYPNAEVSKFIAKLLQEQCMQDNEQ